MLDKPITQDEIITSAKAMKNKKACGYDSISNEMIKCSIIAMMNVLHKIFNHVLRLEIFPKSWAEGYINPLFKKGDPALPSNYRGITISSCLGKLFTRIMNERFMKFLELKGLIPVNQIGFTPRDSLQVNEPLIMCLSLKPYVTKQNIVEVPFICVS